MKKLVKYRISEKGGNMKIKILSLMFLLSIFIFSFDYKELLLGDTKGNIYVQENIYEVRPLASMTKVMTILLTLDKVHSKEISMNDNVIISNTASKIPYGVKLNAGESLTVEELLKATAIRSSNNAAYALAEYVSGGDAGNFVNMMNIRAKKLGMDSTRYCTPHGLPPGDTGTCMDQGSADDMYKLAIEAIKYPEYMSIANKSSDYIKGGTVQLKATNNLLGKVDGVDGLKTGYHRAAGSNIILTAERDGLRIVTVVMGSQKAKNRDTVGADEINYFFSNYKTGKIIDARKPVTSIKINNKNYNLYPSEDIEEIVNINNFDQTKVEFKLNITNRLPKRLKDGEILGDYIAVYEGNEYSGKLKYKQF